MTKTLITCPENLKVEFGYGYGWDGLTKIQTWTLAEFNAFVMLFHAFSTMSAH